MRITCIQEGVMNSMSNIITHIDGEKLKVLKGFQTNDGEILISDAVSFGDCKEVRVVIEPSLIKHWLEECNLMEEVGVVGTIW